MKGSTMNDISKEVKLQLLQNELAVYGNTVYVLTIRHRVNKKLRQTEEQLKPLVEEIVKSETAIDELKKIIAEVESDDPKDGKV